MGLLIALDNMVGWFVTHSLADLKHFWLEKNQVLSLFTTNDQYQSRIKQDCGLFPTLLQLPRAPDSTEAAS